MATKRDVKGVFYREPFEKRRSQDGQSFQGQPVTGVKCNVIRQSRSLCACRLSVLPRLQHTRDTLRRVLSPVHFLSRFSLVLETILLTVNFRISRVQFTVISYRIHVLNVERSILHFSIADRRDITKENGKNFPGRFDPMNPSPNEIIRKEIQCPPKLSAE